MKTMLVSKLRSALMISAIAFLALIPLGGALLRHASADIPVVEQGDRIAHDQEPAPIQVVVTAHLYEVDDVVYKRLASEKRLSRKELDELEREWMKQAPQKPEWNVSEPLDKQKLLQAGKEMKLKPGQERELLSRYKEAVCLPSPEQARKGAKDKQRVREGVAIVASFQISGDRRYMRAKLTEKSAELEGVDRVTELTDNGDDELEAEIPFMREASHTQTRNIPDGGTFLFPLQYRFHAVEDGDRRLVLKITARIYIAEEEEQRRDGQ